MAAADPLPPIDEEDVRRTAYFLWEQDGYPDGQAQVYWYRAWAQHRRMRGYDDALAEGPNEADAAAAASEQVERHDADPPPER